MRNADPAVPPTRTRRRALWAGAALLLAAAVGASFLVRWRPRPAPARDLLAEAVAASPFLNVRPGAAYADEAACAECHADLARAYARHPMGRSASAVGPDGPAPERPFEAGGYRFAAERRTGELVHRAQKLDGTGEVVAQADRAVRYVIGSGERGRSYLFELDGCLFQSPISWFAQTQTWDLSPGFRAFYPPEPAIVPACLFCHVNRAEPVPHTRSRYRTPAINGPAIGCQRCHGPGEAHVQARRRGEAVGGAFDATVVNPRHLPPLLRDNVCQQCHLQGEKRVVRRGRGPFDYRPGLPLHLFWSVFARGPEAGDSYKAVGHVEQMQASRCFRASAGQMSCTTCHDPHRQPAPDERVSEYRRKCLDCHESRPCTLPAVERRRHSADDSCVQCHMPRFATSNIAHTAVTDHRILRRPSAERRGPPPPPPGPGEAPLVNFFQAHLDLEDTGAERDRGLALLELARQPGPWGPQFVELARPLLEQAARACPDDVEAREALGLALAMGGREEDGLKEWEQVLREVPDREGSLGLAAQALQRRGDREGALRYVSRLVEVNPANALTRVPLARLLGERGDWPAARAQCEAALRVNPFSAEARQFLVVCCLRVGDRKRAEAELALLVRLQPGRKQQLEAWFAAQAGGGAR
jgi:predicted CXXCH cytochrome family protein